MRKYNFGEFCLETTWEELGEGDLEVHSAPGEAVTLSCDACQEKAQNICIVQI